MIENWGRWRYKLDVQLFENPERSTRSQPVAEIVIDEETNIPAEDRLIGDLLVFCHFVFRNCSNLGKNDIGTRTLANLLAITPDILSDLLEQGYAGLPDNAAGQSVGRLWFDQDRLLQRGLAPEDAVLTARTETGNIQPRHRFISDLDFRNERLTYVMKTKGFGFLAKGIIYYVIVATLVMLGGLAV